MYFCAPKCNKRCMNYEELLAARNEGKQQKTHLPIGDYYREQIDGKWRGVVEVHEELSQNLAFTKALESECEQNKTLNHSRQLHFTLVKEQGDVKRLELAPGNYQTFEQLLKDNPAIVAGKDFLDNVLKDLVDITSYLHQQGVRHVCYSPRTIFVRKGDHALMLLSHGSFYQQLADKQAFYGDDAQYVAPEVLSGGSVDDRCDVYSIGRFLQSVVEQSDLPIEYRAAVKKAVSELPEARFDTPEDLLKAVMHRRSTLRSVVTGLLALFIALAFVGIYFELFPETSPVEFVKPAPRQPMDDLLDDGITPEELGLGVQGDSLLEDTLPTQRDYDAKAEEIFRRKYEKEAERILSKIYNKDYMNNSEKKFMSESESTIDELMKVQDEMTAESGLSPERARLISSQIIERITEQKKKALGGTNSRGIQK